MKQRVRLLAWVSCLTFLLGLGLVMRIQADDDQATGRFGQTTADWWQWFFSIPASVHPLLDDTGANAAVGQADHACFYLVGALGSADRTISVPFGKPLFGAIVNYENDNIFYDPPVDVGQLRKDAAAIIDTAQGLVLTLDGVSRLDLVNRIKSPVFEYTLPAEDNLYQFFGADVSGTIRPAVSDGYWFYIPNLNRGTHTLHFTAANPTFGGDVTYTINVN